MTANLGLVFTYTSVWTVAGKFYVAPLPFPSPLLLPYMKNTGGDKTFRFQ